MILIKSDARRVPLRDETVQCCVTSPPYYGLRDYGVTGQIGLEQTPDEYITELVQVFREVWRVLRRDGTLWVNIGDSYSREGGKTIGLSRHWDGRKNDPGGMHQLKQASVIGLKPKDLIGIPWMLAFALRDDGWYLRQDIIWAKPNPMPESVKDRCTKAHEYLFLLSKSPKYFFDADAIAEKSYHAGETRISSKKGYCSSAISLGKKPTGNAIPGSIVKIKEFKNKRSVWTVGSQPFIDSGHFAVFPPALIEPCIKAGSRPGDYVLDPFGGSGTTVRVATELQRIGIHCDLTYHELAKITRCRNIQVRMDL